MQYKAIAIVTAILLVSSVVLAGQSAFAAQEIDKSSSVGQHVSNDKTIAIKSIKFEAKKTKGTVGTITVQIVQGNNVVASDEISTNKIKKTNKYSTLTAPFNGAVVTGNYDVLITFDGKGEITLKDKADKRNRVPGNLFEENRENTKRDLVLKIRTTSVNGNNGTPNNQQSPPPQNNSPQQPNTQQPPPGPQTYSVTVNSKNVADNSDIFGLPVQITRNAAGSVTTGSTPMSFAAISGEAYTISVSDSGSTQFVRWLDTGDTNRDRSIAVTSAATFTAEYNAGYPPPPQPPAGSDPNGITVYAYRIPSWHWGATFTSANANMYFVLYNSTGFLIQSGYADENGYTVGGLESGATYYVYPTDCDGCHGGHHDVVFRHWEDSSTERPRGVVPGTSVGANYEYVPWADNPS